jgi:hypothetical protein
LGDCNKTNKEQRLSTNRSWKSNSLPLIDADERGSEGKNLTTDNTDDTDLHGSKKEGKIAKLFGNICKGLHFCAWRVRRGSG